MRAAKTDGNQSSIVDGLRAAGCSVHVTSSLGGGFPDLVCAYAGRNYLLEVKDPSKPLSDRKLTPDQARFFGSWRGQVCVVETLDDALIAVKYIKPLDPSILIGPRTVTGLAGMLR